MLYFVNWTALWNDENPVIGFSQEQLAQCVRLHCYHSMFSYSFRSPNPFVIAYMVVFGVAWVVRLISFALEVRDILRMFLFYSRKLHLADVRSVPSLVSLR